MVYNTFITQEGKNEVLTLAFSSGDVRNTFSYLALGTAGEGSDLASVTGNESDFHEIPAQIYTRPEAIVDVENDGSVTLSFTIDSTNVTEEVQIKEIALCNSAEGNIPTGVTQVFAFCEVPAITKTNSVSLKYTIKVSIE